MLGENLRLDEPDASFFSLSSHKEERAGERRPFGTPLSGSLPARASQGEREPGFDRQIIISLTAAHRSAEFHSARCWGTPARGTDPMLCRMQFGDTAD
jgi:hypothetical protein